VAGASIGELGKTIIADQFTRLRDGDRLWYENIFSGQELRQLQKTSLADIIERNTNVRGLQENVFFMQTEVRGQVTLAPSITTSSIQFESSHRNRGGTRQVGVAGVTIELLDNAGNLLDLTVTDRQGNYRFRSIAETGDCTVRLAASNSVVSVSSSILDLLVSNGATKLRGLDFRVMASQ